MKQKTVFLYIRTWAMTLLVALGCLVWLPLTAEAATQVACPDGATVNLGSGQTYKEVCKNHQATDTGGSTGKAKTDQAAGSDTTTSIVNDPSADPASDCKRNNCDLIKKYVNPAINLLSALVGIAVALSIIQGGIQYSTSGGDPQKAAKAKARITNSIIALVAFIFLFAFIQWLVPGGVLNRTP